MCLLHENTVLGIRLKCDPNKPANVTNEINSIFNTLHLHSKHT